VNCGGVIEKSMESRDTPSGQNILAPKTTIFYFLGKLGKKYEIEARFWPK
jgi:hypothetical protein